MEKIALVEMKGEVFDLQAATKHSSSLSCNQSLCSVVLVTGTNSFNFKFLVMCSWCWHWSFTLEFETQTRQRMLKMLSDFVNNGQIFYMHFMLCCRNVQHSMGTVEPQYNKLITYFWKSKIVKSFGC
jgi:hypothetical protein